MAAHIHHQHGPEGHYPGSMYNEKWVQDLIRQLKDFVGSNYSWLGLDPEEHQRVLDYACGNGTISEGLALVCPKTVFQGIDIMPKQIDRFNEAASKLLGDDSSRMSAVEGDLYKPSQVLQGSTWYDFDVAVTSMALHHFSDPVDMLRRLAERVKIDRPVIVVDWLNELPLRRDSTDGDQRKTKEPYHPTDNSNPEHMEEVHGAKIWAGFTIESVKECFRAAGLRNPEVKLHPGLSKMPENLKGDKQIFYAKAYVS